MPVKTRSSFTQKRKHKVDNKSGNNKKTKRSQSSRSAALTMSSTTAPTTAPNVTFVATTAVTTAKPENKPEITHTNPADKHISTKDENKTDPKLKELFDSLSSSPSSDSETEASQPLLSGKKKCTYCPNKPHEYLAILSKMNDHELLIILKLKKEELNIPTSNNPCLESYSHFILENIVEPNNIPLMRVSLKLFGVDPQNISGSQEERIKQIWGDLLLNIVQKDRHQIMDILMESLAKEKWYKPRNTLLYHVKSKEMINILLKSGSDPKECKLFDVQTEAALNYFVNDLKRPIDEVDPDSKDTILHTCSADLVGIAIKYGAKTNALNVYDRTPLMTALTLEKVKILLPLSDPKDNPIDKIFTDICDNKGILIREIFNHPKWKVLIGDINAAIYEDETDKSVKVPLIFTKGRDLTLDIIKMMVEEFKVDLNAVDSNGKTIKRIIKSRQNMVEACTELGLKNADE